MTTVASTSKGLISSAGLGSGLNVDDIVKAMVRAESQPLTDLQSEATRMQTKLSALGSVKSYLATFRDAASALTRPATWNATQGASSNAAAVSIATETGAAPGSYAVNVTRLATAQTLSSRVFGADEAVGEGSLRIEGTGTGGAAAVDIAISATDTLAAVRDKINAADGGATAHIQTDSTGSRLVLQALKSGTAGSFKVSSPDADPASGLAALTYDPAASTNPLTQQQPGVDAAATINGVAVSSSSNTLTNVLEGMTITLGNVTTAPVSLTVTRDTAAVKTNVTAMVTAYNALQNFLASQTKYDASTKTAATLQGDSATNGIRNQLRAAMSGSTTASSSFTRLSEVGFDLQKDGTIILNDAKLTSALKDPGELRKLFAASDTTDSTANGLGTQLRKVADSMLGADGVLTSRTSGLQSSISTNGKRQADMQTRIDKYQARVEKQYTALDSKMSELNSLSAYVTQQITQMNKSTS